MSQIFVVTIESINCHSYAYSWLGLIIPRLYERETELFHFRQKGPKFTSSKTFFHRVNLRDGGYLRNDPDDVILNSQLTFTLKLDVGNVGDLTS